MNILKYRLCKEEGDVSGAGGSEPDPEVVKTARERGWQPKERWRGPPEAWVDADEYVKRS